MSADNVQPVRLNEEQFTKNLEDLKKTVETIKTLSGLNNDSRERTTK